MSPGISRTAASAVASLRWVHMAPGDIVTWAARVVWLAMAPVGGAAFGEALADRSRSVQLTATVLLWVFWTAVALAFLVPSTVSLTVARTIVPGAVVVAVLAAVHADDAVDAVVCVAIAIAAAALVASGELGEAFAQASAYGGERRFPLRPPVAFIIPAAVSWVVLCACAIAGPLALAAGSPVAGGALTLAAVVLSGFLGRRFHRLSRRWLVVVPAGLVIHDHVVLAETVMFRRAAVTSMGLALVDTEAADLTGPAPGHAVEIALREPATIVLAPTREKRDGTTLHASAVLIAPSRPGRALAAARSVNVSVG
jgi:hypothetical protein